MCWLLRLEGLSGMRQGRGQECGVQNIRRICHQDSLGHDSTAVGRGLSTTSALSQRIYIKSHGSLSGRSGVMGDARIDCL